MIEVLGAIAAVTSVVSAFVLKMRAADMRLIQTLNERVQRLEDQVEKLSADLWRARVALKHHRDAR